MATPVGTLEVSLPAATLPGPAATDALAERLAPALRAGDVILLDGPVGAGKTAFARALIRARQAAAGLPRDDVPSPTYTLVQTYHAGQAEIWHADLYRLGHPDEVSELGLDAAFADAICLIEWPDRLAGALPDGAIRLALTPSADGAARTATLTGPADPIDRLAPVWPAPADPNDAPEVRAAARARLLDAAGWTDARVVPLAGDASARRYARLQRPGGDSAVLMDAPPPETATLDAFIAIGAHLRAAGLSAPEVLAADTTTGFVLLEDLGDGLLSREAAARPADEPALYAAAARALAAMQAAPPPADLPSYLPEMADLAGLAVDWYAAGPATDRRRLVSAMQDALDAMPRAASVLVHRDWHADNLLWLPQRRGIARVGVLDFQDAMTGPPEYDLASMVHDPRRAVSEAAGRAALDAFGAWNAHRLAVCSAQRALRILGVFARLCLRDGKVGYLDFVGPTWAVLMRDLAHPALAGLRGVVADTLAPPTAAGLGAMRARAGQLAGRTRAPDAGA